MMKKKRIWAVVVLALAMMLSACSSNDSETQAEETKAQTSQETQAVETQEDTQASSEVEK